MLTFCSGVQRLIASAALSPVSPCAMVETCWNNFYGASWRIYLQSTKFSGIISVFCSNLGQ